MTLREFRQSLNTDLENLYGIPFSVKRIREDEKNDFHYRIFEERSGYQIGFDLTLFWRKIYISLSSNQHVIDYKIYNYFRENVGLNIDFINSISSHLDANGAINFEINGRKYSSFSKDLLDFSWEMIGINYTSKYIEVYDALEIHYEEIKNIIINFAAIVLMFIFSNISIGAFEGNRYESESIKYERNPINRKLCIEANGFKCKVCGADLESLYGDVAHNFIEIHHLIPVSTYSTPKIINPILDLIPICPNCHRIAHKRFPPYTPEEIRLMLGGKHGFK